MSFRDDRKNFKVAVDNGNDFDALLTDLSKAFDCIDHSLLLAKLYGYGAPHLSLKLFTFCEPNSTCQKNNCFSKSSKIDYSILQGSILGSFFFNINLIGVFWMWGFWH